MSATEPASQPARPTPAPATAAPRHGHRLARLQQLTTLGLLLAAAAWACGAAWAGRPGWALAGVAAVIFGYAAVLGLEFVLLFWAHGDDPAPRATPTQLLRAWWGEVLTAPRVFGWRQPFRSRVVPDHLPADARGRRGVLLVHGFVCNRGLWNDWLQRLSAQGTPCVAVNLEPVFGPIEATAPVVEAGIRVLEQATGLPPVVVGHSMGGLALRAWWAGDPRNDRRIAHAITIATPHHGTALATLAFSANGRQMRRHSPWLRALAAAEPPDRHAHITCFYGHCDNIAFPPSTAALPGAAANLHLAGTAHVHLVARPEPWDELQRRLAAPAQPASGA